MPKDPKDWQGWALGGACILVFAFGAVIGSGALNRLANIEARASAIEMDHASFKVIVSAMKETLDRIEKKVDKR